MPITIDELGITTDQYNVLANSETGAKWDVTLYRWIPEFSILSGDPLYFPDFDAIEFNGHYIQVNSFMLFNDGIQDLTYNTDSFKAGCPLSLATDGTDLAVFAITSSGISMNKYSSGSWSDFSSIIKDSTILFRAATSLTSIHFITYDTSHHRFRFHCATYSGSWSVNDSEIYWGYSITSFTAKKLNDIDYLAITSDLPGVQSVSVLGTTTVKKIIPSGGISMFSYKYGSWSDHWVIDNIDQWSSFRYRSYIRMSIIDDTLWLTSYSSEGTIDTPITGYRIYNSKDGRHWSRGELLVLPADSNKGLVIIAIDTILYAFTYSEYYCSERTLWFGNPHSDSILSLAGYTLELSVNRQDTQQLNLIVDNRRNWLSNTIADGSHTLAAILKTGYNDQQIQTGIFEIDTFEPVLDLPKISLQLTGRDHMAWMTTKSQSEQFLNWTPQIIGLDEYIDSTGTGYGGMTHSAPTEGTFQAFDGALQLVSNNEEGLAYNTNLYDNWNGSVESYTTLASLGNSEYIGLAFRSPDGDNGFFYYYDQASDKLKLDQRLGGSVTNLYQSSTMSWSGSLDSHFLRVEYYYCKIIMYYSNDTSGGGITWVELSSIIVDGQVPVSDGDLNPLVQSGYVGSFGRGFSNLSESDPNPDDIPEGDLPINYLPYDPGTPDTPTQPEWHQTIDVRTNNPFLSGWFDDNPTGAPIVWTNGVGIVSAKWTLGDNRNYIRMDYSTGSEFDITRVSFDYNDPSTSFNANRYAVTYDDYRVGLIPPSTIRETYNDGVSVYGNQTFDHFMTNSLGVKGVYIQLSNEEHLASLTHLVITEIRISGTGLNPF